VTGATAVRMSIGGASLAVGRVPRLARLGIEASLLPAPGADRAQTAFLDELVGLCRELSETSWRELRRGVADLDELTRPRVPAGTAQPGTAQPGTAQPGTAQPGDGPAPRRRHRVKP